MNITKVTRASVALVAVCGLTLAGCSKADDKSAESTTTAAATTSAAAKSSSAKSSSAEATPTLAKQFTAENFHLHDAFVKAMPADKHMTAVFGMLENHTDTAAHLVGFTTSLNAKMNQIHEVVDGKMQEKKDGITIPAHGQHMLEPGHDHLMIMGLDKPVEAGSKITVNLVFADGSEVTIKDVPARQIGAGDEKYSTEGHDHDGMKMEGMKMDDHSTEATTMKMDAK